MGSNFIINHIFFSLGVAQWGAFNQPSATFFLLPTRGWELLIGVFAAFYLNYKTYIKSYFLNQVLSLFGFGMIVYSIIVFDNTTPFPSLYALIPTIGTGLLILCAVPQTYVHKLLSSKFIVGIGLISYSAYLWHQPLFSFARHRLLGDVSDPILIILSLISLAMAWFSWRFVEKPFRDKKIITQKKIFIFSLLGIGVFCSIGLSLHFKQGYEKRANFTEEMTSSFERPSVDNCFDIPFNHFVDQWGCNLGADKERVDFILFGDSHSLSLRLLIDDVARQKGIKVFFTGSSGCLPFVGIYPDRTDQNVRNCNLLNERVYNLSKVENIKGIILSARWSYYTLGNYDFRGSQFISDKENGPFTLQHSIDTFSKAFESTVKKYNSIKIPIHLITQPPHQKYHAESAYFFISKGLGTIENMSIKKSDFQKLNKIPINVFSTYEDEVDVYNITEFFCDELFCPIGDQTGSFYYDEDHLSAYGALKLEGIIETIFLNESPLITN